MTRHGFAVSSPAMDAMLVAGVSTGFLALWMVWPDVRAAPQAAAPSQARTHFVFSTVGAVRAWPCLVRPPPYGPDSDPEETAKVTISAVRIQSAALLSRDGEITTPVADSMASDGRDPMAQVEDRYVPFIGDPTVLPPWNAAAGLSVQLSGDLRSCKCDTSPLSSMAAALPASSWTLTAFISTDRRGNVEHVFLEEPSQYGDVNATMVSALRRCRIENGGAAAEGLVSISAHGGSTAARDGKQ